MKSRFIVFFTALLVFSHTTGGLASTKEFLEIPVQQDFDLMANPQNPSFWRWERRPSPLAKPHCFPLEYTVFFSGLKFDPDQEMAFSVRIEKFNPIHDGLHLSLSDGFSGFYKVDKMPWTAGFNLGQDFMANVNYVQLALFTKKDKRTITGRVEKIRLTLICDDTR